MIRCALCDVRSCVHMPRGIDRLSDNEAMRLNMQMIHRATRKALDKQMAKQVPPPMKKINKILLLMR